MDEKSKPTRIEAALERQQAAMKTIALSGRPSGADIMGIIARQRVIRELLVRAGVVSDHDGRHPIDVEGANALWDDLEAEAKADVLEDIADALLGRPNDHVSFAGGLETATKMPEKH